MNNEFQKCLKLGQAIEKKAQQKLIEYYKNKYTVLHECNNYNYYFKLSNDKTYEVKYCSLNECGDTVFLETIAFNKLSGINKTEANYYIFVIKGITNIFNKTNILTFIKINVKSLIKIIKKQLFFKYYQDDLKQGFVISIEIIKKFGKDINRPNN